MGLYFQLPFKNIFRQKKRAFSLGINYTIVAFILLLLFSFSGGVRENITRNVARSNAGHITISGNYYVNGKAYRGILQFDKIKQIANKRFGAEIEIFTRYILRSSVYYNGLSKRLQFTGIDPEIDNGFETQVEFLSGGWAEYRTTPNGIIVSKQIAEYFDFGYNDDVLVATRTRFGAFNTGTLKIKGVYESFNYFIRDQVIAHFDFLRNLDLAQPDAASTMYFYFKDSTKTAEKRDALMEDLAAAGFITSKPKTDAEALDAISAASPRSKKLADPTDRIELTLATLDEAIGLVRTIVSAVNGIGLFISFVMLFIIAVSIFINLRMTIHDRLAEIGTMRTIGLEGRSVIALFMIENVFLALVFVIIGIVAALFVVALFVFVVELPSSELLSLFLDDGHLVLVPSIGAIAGTSMLIVLFAAVFSYIPARFGGRISPVDALNRVF